MTPTNTIAPVVRFFDEEPTVGTDVGCTGGEGGDAPSFAELDAMGSDPGEYRIGRHPKVRDDNTRIAAALFSIPAT